MVVLKHEDGIHAFGGTCSHLGCDLWRGKLEGHVVTCPCHGSQFDISDGSNVHGPATAPVPSYEVQEREGKLQVELAHDQTLIDFTKSKWSAAGGPFDFCEPKPSQAPWPFSIGASTRLPHSVQLPS